MFSFQREGSLFLIKKHQIGFCSNLLPIYIYEEDDLEEPSENQLNILKYLEDTSPDLMDQMNNLFLKFCNMQGSDVIGENPLFSIVDISIPNLAGLNEVFFVIGANINWNDEMSINFFVFNSIVIGCDYIDAIFYGTSCDRVIHSKNEEELKTNIRIFVERYFDYNLYTLAE